jgi:hypothetical protein
MAKKPPNPGLADVVREGVRAGIACVHTCAPAIVKSYDRERQSATVQLTVRGRRIDQRSGERSTYPHRPIPNVPVVFQGTPRSGSTDDLQPGDPVLVWFAERDTQPWLNSGESDVSPVDSRRHDLTDAYCTPGAFPFVKITRPANAVAEGAHVIYGDDIRVGSADAVKPAALAPDVEERLAAIESHLSALKTWIDTHGHAAGLGAPPLPPLSPGVPDLSESVAATKVKIE